MGSSSWGLGDRSPVYRCAAAGVLSSDVCKLRIHTTLLILFLLITFSFFLSKLVIFFFEPRSVFFFSFSHEHVCILFFPFF